MSDDGTFHFHGFDDKEGRVRLYCLTFLDQDFGQTTLQRRPYILNCAHFLVNNHFGFRRFIPHRKHSRLAIQLEKHHPVAQFIGLGFVEVFHHDVFALGQFDDDFFHGFHAKEKDFGREMAQIAILAIGFVVFLVDLGVHLVGKEIAELGVEPKFFLKGRKSRIQVQWFHVCIRRYGVGLLPL